MKIVGIILGLVIWAASGCIDVSAMGKSGDDGGSPTKTKNEELLEGISAANTGRYQEAIRILTDVVSDDPQNADAHNYLGYSYRKSGALERAAEAYRRVFEIDQDHRGALEYQGELYLKLGDISSAKRNLVRLTKLCPSGCKEMVELKRAIADYEAVRNNKKGN